MKCAIRWDAWYTNGKEDPAHYTAEALSPLRFHRLAPTHATFDMDGNITWSASQTTFDAEILAAHKADFCWAYLMYGKNNVINLTDSMMKGLALHRRSSIKSQVKYSLIATTSVIGHPGNYSDAAAVITKLMSDSNYQRLPINGIYRPLLFLYYSDVDLKTIFNGSLKAMRGAIDLIRHVSINSGSGNPYIVILLGPKRAAEEARSALGADAISAYVAGTRKAGVESWSEFERTIEAEWSAYAEASGGGVIPTLRTGADIRARCESPPPYDHRFGTGFDCSQFYVVTPTLHELATEFQHAKRWVSENAAKDPGKLLLVYAWSECDESGNCLMPTVGDPDCEKLSAINDAMRNRSGVLP